MRAVVLLLACQTCASQGRKSQIVHIVGGVKLEKHHSSQDSKDSTTVRILPALGKWASLSSRRLVLVIAAENHFCRQLSRRFLLLLLCHKAGTHFRGHSRHGDKHIAILSALLAFESSVAFSNPIPTFSLMDSTSAILMPAAVAEGSLCITGLSKCRHCSVDRQTPRASFVMLRVPRSTPPSLKRLFGQAADNETSVNASPKKAAETFSFRTVLSPADLVSIESLVSSVIRKSRYPITEDDPGIVEGVFLSANALVTNILDWVSGGFKPMEEELMAGPDAAAASFEGFPEMQLKPSDHTYQPAKVFDACGEDLPGVSLVITCHSKNDDGILGIVQFTARRLPPPAYIIPCKFSLSEAAVANSSAANATAAAAAAEPVPFWNVVFIKFIGVSSSARRRGVATALLDWATRKARAWGADGVALQVHESNNDALRFYFAQGFETVPNWIGGDGFPYYLLVKGI